MDTLDTANFQLIQKMVTEELRQINDLNTETLNSLSTGFIDIEYAKKLTGIIKILHEDLMTYVDTFDANRSLSGFASDFADVNQSIEDTMESVITTVSKITNENTKKIANDIAEHCKNYFLFTGSYKILKLPGNYLQRLGLISGMSTENYISRMIEKHSNSFENVLSTLEAFFYSPNLDNTKILQVASNEFKEYVELQLCKDQLTHQNEVFNGILEMGMSSLEKPQSTQEISQETLTECLCMFVFNGSDKFPISDKYLERLRLARLSHQEKATARLNLPTSQNNDPSKNIPTPQKSINASQNIPNPQTHIKIEANPAKQIDDLTKKILEEQLLERKQIEGLHELKKTVVLFKYNINIKLMGLKDVFKINTAWAHFNFLEKKIPLLINVIGSMPSKENYVSLVKILHELTSVSEDFFAKNKRPDGTYKRGYYQIWDDEYLNPLQNEIKFFRNKIEQSIKIPNLENIDVEKLLENFKLA